MSKPLVVFLSFNKKAFGASVVPVLALRHCKQCLDSSWRSNPGRDLSTDGGPSGNVKRTTRSCSPIATAIS
eukprot:9355280-Pyramimonas_sp.AAC.1